MDQKELNLFLKTQTVVSLVISVLFYTWSCSIFGQSTWLQQTMGIVPHNTLPPVQETGANKTQSQMEPLHTQLPNQKHSQKTNEEGHTN